MMTLIILILQWLMNLSREGIDYKINIVKK